MGIKGKTIVFTGKISQPRHIFQAMVEEHGGIAGTAVTKSTDYLVVGDKPGSKLVQAMSLGIPTLSEKEFLKLLEEPDQEEDTEPDYCGTGPGSLRHHWFRTTIRKDGSKIEECLCGTIKITQPDGTWTKHEPRHVIEQARRIAHRKAVLEERQYHQRLQKQREEERYIIQQLEKLSSKELEELEKGVRWSLKRNSKESQIGK